MCAENKDQFRKALREIKNLPTLPGIVAKLSKMAEDPDTTTEQMGRLKRVENASWSERSRGVRRRPYSTGSGSTPRNLRNSKY